MYLNCHSYYSLRYGTLSIEELLKTAAFHQIKALALTDINNTTGVFEFVSACRAAGIKPLVGVEFRRQEELLYIAIAKNCKGFQEINEWLTARNLENKPLPLIAPSSSNVVVIYPLHSFPDKLRPNEYVGVRPQEVYKLQGVKIAANRIASNKLLIWQPVTVSSRVTHKLHKLLRAVDLNTLVTKLSAESICQEDEQMLPKEVLLNYYKGVPEIVRNTEKVIEECNFVFEYKSPKNKKTYTGSRSSDKQLLGSLALDGIQRRYGANHVEAQKRMVKELEIINQMGFAAYFLITWDIIRYSRSKGFFHVGRGSGANSIVGYALGITNVCPLELNLYFERFLNPNRTSPPDFDIDWSWKHRDDILNYVFNRFDFGKVAFIGTVTHFKRRSVVRELGKTLGLPKEELDFLANFPKDQHPSTKINAAIHYFGKMLTGFPNIRSIHACGVLISEEKLTAYSPIDMPPKGLPTVQFDMFTGENIGFEKLDILGQRGIGHIGDCVKYIEENRGRKIDIHDEVERLKIDAKSNRMLQKGETIGCFYVESPAMRGLLQKLQCDNFSLLVAATSIIRPGVAQSGMMGEFIRRHHQPERTTYLHSSFEEHLKETYGIMVYQEDVIKIAHYFAGLDLADADVLRRAMSGKYRSQAEFLRIKERFFESCRRKGFSDSLTQEVYRQIESFAGYSFCKAHSASYSIESYQSLFLKAYFPLEFMTAVLNNFGGFYQAEVYFLEARRLGAIIELPCVNNSCYLSSIEDKTLYIGFNYLKNLSNKVSKEIQKERTKNGLFDSLQDFVQRVAISLESLEVLIFIGAFRFTGIGKNELALEMRMLLQKPVVIAPTLFEVPIKKLELPELPRKPLEDAFDEIEILGFPISYTAFELLKEYPENQLVAKDFDKMLNQTITIVGYFVCRKNVHSKKGLMNFGCFIDQAGKLFDTVHFPEILKRYPIWGKGCYEITGKVVYDFGHCLIEVIRLEQLPYLTDVRYE